MANGIWVHIPLPDKQLINPVQTVWGRGGGKCQRWLWTFITFSIFNQTLPNFATLFKIYLEVIWYNRLLCRELDVATAIPFWQMCFSKFVTFVFLLIRINLSAVNFTIWGLYFCSILLFFSNFWRSSNILENFEIQEGGSKMAAVWTSWHICHVISCHHPMWHILKDRFSDIL